MGKKLGFNHSKLGISWRYIISYNLAKVPFGNLTILRGNAAFANGSDGR
jgi:hypothetical protein